VANRHGRAVRDRTTWRTKTNRPVASSTSRCSEMPPSCHQQCVTVTNLVEYKCAIFGEGGIHNLWRSSSSRRSVSPSYPLSTPLPEENQFPDEDKAGGTGLYRFLWRRTHHHQHCCARVPIVATVIASRRSIDYPTLGARFRSRPTRPRSWVDARANDHVRQSVQR